MSQVADTPEPFDPFNPAADNDLSLSALVRSIRYADSYALLFAVCNQNTLRDRLIKEIKDRLPGTIFDEIRLSDPIPNLFRFFEMRYPGTQSPSGPVMIYGIEAWLPGGRKGENSDFVMNLNITRDLFPTIINRPLILWLPEHALASIFHASPDFFSARSGVFFFAETDQERIEMLAAINTLGLEGIAGLPLKEKRDRISLIETLLTEYGRLPPEKKDPRTEIRLKEAAAETYYVMGEYKKAEPILQDLMDRNRTNYGSESKEYASSLNNLALLLRAINRLDESENYMREALDIDERLLGPENPNVAIELANLAGLLQATERTAEAEQLLRKSLAILERSFGPDHPKVAAVLGNLAHLIKRSKRFDEAEPLMRKALEIDERSFGSNHPSVATRLNNLASLLQDANNLAEAEPMLRKALEIWQHLYGIGHPFVAIALNNLGHLLIETKRLDEAEPLMRRALAIFEKSLGAEHPNLALVLGNLAMLEWARGNNKEAEEILIRALAIFRRNYDDENNPHILKTLQRLKQVQARSGSSAG
ncbi:MAG TPA: tetratricopeptide repeat protein [bacterium]|nr:tetratricopeptide repeat protein [bacterium]